MTGQRSVWPGPGGRLSLLKPRDAGVAAGCAGADRRPAATGSQQRQEAQQADSIL